MRCTYILDLIVEWPRLKRESAGTVVWPTEIDGDLGGFAALLQKTSIESLSDLEVNLFEDLFEMESRDQWVTHSRLGR